MAVATTATSTSVATSALTIAVYPVSTDRTSKTSGVRSSTAYPVTVNPTCASVAATTTMPRSRCQASALPPSHRSTGGIRLTSVIWTSSTYPPTSPVTRPAPISTGPASPYHHGATASARPDQNTTASAIEWVRMRPGGGWLTRREGTVAVRWPERRCTVVGTSGAPTAPTVVPKQIRAAPSPRGNRAWLIPITG